MQCVDLTGRRAIAQALSWRPMHTLLTAWQILPCTDAGLVECMEFGRDTISRSGICPHDYCLYQQLHAGYPGQAACLIRRTDSGLAQPICFVPMSKDGCFHVRVALAQRREAGRKEGRDNLSQFAIMGQCCGKMVLGWSWRRYWTGRDKRQHVQICCTAIFSSLKKPSSCTWVLPVGSAPGILFLARSSCTIGEL